MRKELLSIIEKYSVKPLKETEELSKKVALIKKSLLSALNVIKALKQHYIQSSHPKENAPTATIEHFYKVLMI